MGPKDRNPKVKPTEDRDPLDDELLKEQAEHEYKLDEKQQRMMDYIRQNLPIAGFAEVLTKELWLREVLRDIDSPDPRVRTRAIHMLGQYLGILGQAKAGAKPKAVDVDFD